jgi:hypothetical protein
VPAKPPAPVRRLAPLGPDDPEVGKWGVPAVDGFAIAGGFGAALGGRPPPVAAGPRTAGLAVLRAAPGSRALGDFSLVTRAEGPLAVAAGRAVGVWMLPGLSEPCVLPASGIHWAASDGSSGRTGPPRGGRGGTRPAGLERPASAGWLPPVRGGDDAGAALVPGRPPVGGRPGSGPLRPLGRLVGRLVLPLVSGGVGPPCLGPGSRSSRPMTSRLSVKTRSRTAPAIRIGVTTGANGLISSGRCSLQV